MFNSFHTAHDPGENHEVVKFFDEKNEKFHESSWKISWKFVEFHEKSEPK
jgi:hypothetical protein